MFGTVTGASDELISSDRELRFDGGKCLFLYSRSTTGSS